MGRAMERYEALQSSWSQAGESFGLTLEVFAEPPAKGRMARVAQRLGGASAGVRIGGNRLGYLLSGTVDDVDVTVVAGTTSGDVGDNETVVSEVTHYRAAAPWIPDGVRVGARQIGVKDRLKFANGGSTDWKWIDLDHVELHVRVRDESDARVWLDEAASLLTPAFAANGKLRIIDGGAETDTSNLEADQQVLEARIQAVHHLALDIRSVN